MKPKPPRRLRWLGLGAIIASLAGCSQSSDVSELPDASKKMLIQRKVDVQSRATESTSASPGARNPNNSTKRP
jgi:uncharacterized lipoprotein NlpE involved in copper resistance